MDDLERVDGELSPSKNKKIVKTVIYCVLAALLVGIVVWVIVASVTREKPVKNREYDEAEVLAAANALIPSSLPLNDIFWGKGIPYIDDSNLAEGNYYPADIAYLSSLGALTIEDIKTKAREVYSDDICNWIFDTVFSSVTADGVTPTLARYAQKWGGENLDEPESILVLKGVDFLLEDTVEYDLVNVEVKGSEGERVKLLYLVKVTNPDGEFMFVNKEIAIVEQEDGWRLDTPTYARYYLNPNS